MTLDVKLCLRDDKNAGKRHDVRAQRPEAVSGWLNPLSLGTMSASAYIEDLALNSTSLINYQELSRSI